jgi:hypothetical protein
MEYIDQTKFMTFHHAIARIITPAAFPEHTVKWDFECGGNQRLQLFCRDEKSNPTKYSHADSVILGAGRLKVIVEVEESGGSNIRPIALCGKLLASALTSHFIDSSGCYAFADTVHFVQVVRTNLKPKLAQLKNLEQSIRCVLPMENSRITTYKIICGTDSDFVNGDGSEELMAHLRHSLG